MKILTLICTCVALNAMDVRADECRLVQSQLAENDSQSGKVIHSTVYVLIDANQRTHVFRDVRSKSMNEVLKHFPRGTVLRYVGNALAKQPPQEQLDTLEMFCESFGVKLVMSAMN